MNGIVVGFLFYISVMLTATSINLARILDKMNES